MRLLVPSPKLRSMLVAVHRPLVSDSRLKPEPTWGANSGPATVAGEQPGDYGHISESPRVILVARLKNLGTSPANLPLAL